jgi:hypothetical protein
MSQIPELPAEVKAALPYMSSEDLWELGVAKDVRVRLNASNYLAVGRPLGLYPELNDKRTQAAAALRQHLKDYWDPHEVYEGFQSLFRFHGETEMACCNEVIEWVLAPSQRFFQTGHLPDVLTRVQDTLQAERADHSEIEFINDIPRFGGRLPGSVPPGLEIRGLPQLTEEEMQRAMTKTDHPNRGYTAFLAAKGGQNADLKTLWALADHAQWDAFARYLCASQGK